MHKKTSHILYFPPAPMSGCLFLNEQIELEQSKYTPGHKFLCQAIAAVQYPAALTLFMYMFIFLAPTSLNTTSLANTLTLANTLNKLAKSREKNSSGPGSNPRPCPRTTVE